MYDNHDNLEVLQELIGNHPKTLNYLHNTSSVEVAEEIMKNGFRFEGYIEFTCDLISGYDPVELRYFLQTRSRYGKYTLVIQIGEELIEQYSKLLHKSKHHFSEALAIKTEEGPDDENIYTLAPNFIKGYYDQKKNKHVKNPDFDAHKDLPVFRENLDKLLNQ